MAEKLSSRVQESIAMDDPNPHRSAARRVIEIFSASLDEYDQAFFSRHVASFPLAERKNFERLLPAFESVDADASSTDSLLP
jgi:hypothetical protein